MIGKVVRYLKFVLILFALFFNINNYRLGNNILDTNLIIISFFSIIICILIERDKSKSNIWINILSVIFSLIYVFGNSYYYLKNASLVFGRIDLIILSIFIFIGYYLLFQLILKYVFKFFESNVLIKNIKLNKFQIFDKHPFLVSLIIILFCWLIYIVAFYPAILNPDSSFEIRQFFGIWTKYNEYSVMLSKKVLITNHHPVIYTLFLGSFLKIGHFLGNDNLGLFMCSLIQIIFLSFTLSYSISYLKRVGVSNIVRIFILIVYALCPVFPFYAMTLVKDVLFGCFVMLLIIYLHRFLIDDKFNYFIFLLILLGTFLLRNNGYHIMVFTFLLMLILKKNKWKFSLMSLLFVITLSFCYNDILLPTFKITPGSIREILSVPFQQTARYYRDYENDFSNKDKKVVDKILDISDLGERYKEEISDPVKNKFNKYATDDDLKEYFKVWFKYLFKRPNVYLDATINNTYGYFYPEKTNWYYYHKFDDRIVDNGFNYHYNNLSGLRNILSSFANIFPSLPIVGLIINIAFNVWILFIMLGYFLYKKMYSNITLLLPSFGLVLICILSPVNCYFRYALPYVFAMLTMFGLFINLIKGETNEERSK